MHCPVLYVCVHIPPVFIDVLHISDLHICLIGFFFVSLAFLTSPFCLKICLESDPDNH